MQQHGLQAIERDPEGSIFLPITHCPEREFDNWYLQLLLGRGIADGKDCEQIQALSKELQEARTRHIGANALDAL